MFNTSSIKKLVTVTALAAVLTIINIAPAFAGAVGGRKYDSFRLPARSSQSFTVYFYGGEDARVAVVGDGDTDLDLYIYDQYDNLVAYDENLGDRPFAEWTPRFTGRFTIKVVNRGNVYNDYAIATN